jgi:hypothetical protein
MDYLVLFVSLFFVLLTLTAVFLFVSMNSLEPLQWGITYNAITKSIGTDVYESGRYIFWPWIGFIVYPANLVTVEFSDSRKATVT